MWRTEMLAGVMMNRPLLVSNLIDYAAEVHATRPIISQTVEGGIHRYTYREARARIARLANALIDMGIKPGDRVATLAWNGYRHFELYYAISGIGAVCHTLNPRLSAEQFNYIVNHANDQALFFDITFAPLVEKMAPGLKGVKHYVAMTDAAHLPAVNGVANVHAYETLLANASANLTWPEFDENAACTLCYTSGTTGDPKGALYSHRSTVLHALFALTGFGRAFGPDQSILPVVPMFHVNAWGLNYTAPVTGTSLILPGAKLDGPNLFELMDAEHARSSWGVPTVWLGLLAEMKARGRKPVGLSEVVVGGSAAPRPMIETFERDYGINVVHAWGMTEMSPIGSIGRLSPEQDEFPLAERVSLKTAQGHRMFGVDFKIVSEDGVKLPHDGVAQGELFVRGNSIVSGYFNNEKASAAALDKDGWFGTGDVAKIDNRGTLTIVDRTKDLVKSGGEWISSIDVEGAALAHPGLANAAVIGIPHPKWTERPVLIAVKAPGANPTKDEILALLDAKLAKWQLPDDVIFVDALPLGATGKVSKKDLRAKFADHKLPG
jgi:3-(methylthio)propionyl---CoA ligase